MYQEYKELRGRAKIDTLFFDNFFDKIISFMLLFKHKEIYFMMFDSESGKIVKENGEYIFVK